jgi:hypothetical protein
MLSKFYVWVGKHSVGLFVFALAITCVATLVSLVDVVRKPPTLEQFEGGVQNHLVWSNKGECFFVRPYSSDVVYLIRVPDCDKK